MTHLQGRILLDTVLTLLVIWMISVLYQATLTSYIHKKDQRRRPPQIDDAYKLPRASYKDFGVLDRAFMSFLPTHWGADQEEPVTDLSLYAWTTVNYKLYKGKMVIISKRHRSTSDQQPY